jgi:hypothetical protein
MCRKTKVNACLILFLLGGLFFVVDYLNPLTPDPMIELTKACLLFIALTITYLAACNEQDGTVLEHVDRRPPDPSEIHLPDLATLHCVRLI